MVFKLELDKQTAQSESLEEPNNDSAPLENSSPLAKVEEQPWRWFSSLPVVRGLPGLDRMLVPMGKGSYIKKEIRS